MNSQCARRAILDDIATDPSAPQQQRAEARKALRSQRNGVTRQINRAKQRARRQAAAGGNLWQVYEDVKCGLPEMEPTRYEAVCRELAEILGL